MEFSPAHGSLDSPTKLDTFRPEETFDLKLTEILQRRQRPLLMLINPDGELLYSTIDDSGARRGQSGLTQRLINEALNEAQRPFHEGRPTTGAVEPLAINKPGERCALVTVGRELFCLRLFSLQDAHGARGGLYAVLVEPINRPQSDNINVDRVRCLFRLSKREIDVLGALMSGDTDKEIALKLTVSVETVRAYLKSIRAKLRVKTRTAIVSIIHGVQRERLTPTD
ncbi:MAG TPA: helix-turn-helix transcriptional regulator [Gammaproteobacteria bacterium]|nr:helix-turn-helix transcriptional regulator [Gammaproteobacteria bacterium]